MNEVLTIVLPQDEDTPVKYVENGHFFYRYAYLRSFEARASGKKGQDFLAIKEDGQKFVFGICDGISASFFGEVAAKFLGEKLMDYLWGFELTEYNDQFRAEFNEKLREWAVEATELLEKVELPDSPPMLRDVLKQQQQDYGSQTTFSAGVIDIAKKRMIFIQLGNNHSGFQQDSQWHVETTPRTKNNCWSSKAGTLESSDVVEVYFREPPSAMFVTTDGLADFGNIETLMVDTQSLPNDVLETLFKHDFRGNRDDASFFQLWLNQSPAFDVPLPQGVNGFIGDDMVAIRWSRNIESETYEIEVTTRTQPPQIMRMLEHEYNFPRSQIDSPTRVRVRTRLFGLESPWSMPITLMPAPRLEDVKFDLNRVALNVYFDDVVGMEGIGIEFEKDGQFVGRMVLHIIDRWQDISPILPEALITFRMRFVGDNIHGLWSEKRSLLPAPKIEDFVLYSGNIRGNSAAFENSKPKKLNSISKTGCPFKNYFCMVLLGRKE